MNFEYFHLVNLWLPLCVHTLPNEWNCLWKETLLDGGKINALWQHVFPQGALVAWRNSLEPQRFLFFSLSFSALSCNLYKDDKFSHLGQVTLSWNKGKCMHVNRLSLRNQICFISHNFNCCCWEMLPVIIYSNTLIFIFALLASIYVRAILTIYVLLVSNTRILIKQINKQTNKLNYTFSWTCLTIFAHS